MRRHLAALALLLLAAALLPARAIARPQNATTAGEFVIEPPTLVSLGFEWRISGDDNRNARVDVAFRKRGDQQWRKGLALLRLQHESVTGGTPREGANHYYNYIAPNMFAGSLLNLEPDTEYECRFVLSDPDGVKGKAEKTVTVRTRKEPQPAEGGHVYHVYPFGYKGARQEPSFTGLMAAYYMGSDQSDHSNVMPPRVQPGDIILVHAGIYKDNRFVYSGFDRTIAAYGTPFDGTYYLTQSGTPEKPIVIKSAGDGEVIFDGDGCQNLFNLMGGNYNYFEGVTIRNTNVAFLLGIKHIAGSSGFTLKHSRLENIGRGVEDDWSGSKNFYIADNVFIGRHDPNKLQSWWTPDVWAKFPGYPALITSEYAIKIYGQGHVVAYNYVANWHDGIDIATYGDPDGTPERIARPRPGLHRFLQQRHLQHGGQLHRSRRRRAQHSRLPQPLLQRCRRRIQRATDLRRPALLLSKPCVRQYDRRSTEINRHARGRADLSEHVYRPGPPDGPRVKRSFPEQFDPRRRLGRSGLESAHLHELFQLPTTTASARIPASHASFEWTSPDFATSRPTSAASSSRGIFKTLTEYQQGHRAGSAQRARRLRIFAKASSRTRTTRSAFTIPRISISSSSRARRFRSRAVRQSRHRRGSLAAHHQ